MSDTSKVKTIPPLLDTWVYITISGHRIELAPSAEIGAFLERLEVLFKDKTVSEQSMIGFAYSVQNPILDTTIHPERGVVTKKVLADPAYSVMVDILFRKHVQEHAIDVDALAKRFSLTVQEAADRLHVHHTTLRQAIKAKRIASWVKDGQMYLDPDSIDRFKKQQKIPKTKK